MCNEAVQLRAEQLFDVTNLTLAQTERLTESYNKTKNIVILIALVKNNCCYDKAINRLSSINNYGPNEHKLSMALIQKQQGYDIVLKNLKTKSSTSREEVLEALEALLDAKYNPVYSPVYSFACNYIEKMLLLFPAPHELQHLQQFIKKYPTIPGVKEVIQNASTMSNFTQEIKEQLLDTIEKQETQKREEQRLQEEQKEKAEQEKKLADEKEENAKKATEAAEQKLKQEKQREEEQRLQEEQKRKEEQEQRERAQEQAKIEASAKKQQEVTPHRIEGTNTAHRGQIQNNKRYELQQHPAMRFMSRNKGKIALGLGAAAVVGTGVAALSGAFSSSDPAHDKDSPKTE